MPGCVDGAYLHAVHLEFSNDFDSHFASIAAQVPSAVDVAEGAIAHFLD